MARADVSGQITTQNLNPSSGVATPGGAVELQLSGDYDTASIQVTGTYTGALTVQTTLDGKNWVSLGGASALTNVNTAAQAANIASATQGIFQLDVSGFLSVRVSANAAVTGTANVTIAAGVGSGIVGIDTPIVLGTGAASIGTVATPVGTAYSLTSAATTNAAVIKAATANLFEISVSNPTATPAYIKLYNKASAPTVGTDVPVATIVAPATSATTIQNAINLTFSQIGKRFATGLAIAVTGGPLATDATNAVAGVQIHATYI